MSDKIFTYWNSIGELARDFGTKYSTAQSWVRRGFIPARHDLTRKQLVCAKGGAISFEEMHRERLLAQKDRQSNAA